jgi:aryl-alcohol dehydrogenase-like predicted oxidoreductase
MIAWTVQHGVVSVALCGARTAQQAIQNAGAAKVVLGRDELAAIDGAAARHLGSSF